jgi:aryl-alcohol dehydrogenase-like predicted oxidoreductase
MGPWFTQEKLEEVGRLKRLAGEAGVTLAQLALAWCLRRPEVSSAIIGATKVEHVEENAAAAGVELPDDLLAAIEAA